jgi:putative flippase GtrA
MTALYRRFAHLVHELAKFGVVGLVAYVIDVGLFNLLRFAGGEGPLYDRPLTAKAASVIVAMTFAYFANRNWTWKERERTGFRREYVLFFIVNGIALVISVGVLWISHYVLGFRSPLADNISANGIGLLLGTAFRFYAYRRWVFPETADAALTLPEDASDPAPSGPAAPRS